MTRAGRWGVQAEYTDAADRIVAADPDTVAAALAILAADDDQIPSSGALFVHPGDTTDLRGAVLTEDGRTISLDGRARVALPLGYHRIDTAGGERDLICSPARCHLPPGLRTGGWAAQLYAMRSAQSWGIGDLADLRSFARWASGEGAGFALLNPLSASSPVPPIEPSPYLPSSRRFRNPLYLRVEDVPGAAAVAEAVGGLAAQGRALNQLPLIDRDRVSALKLDALARIHAAVPPGREFAQWLEGQGEPLRRFATFCAIAEEHGGDWRRWPAALQRPVSSETRQAGRRLAARVSFHAWLQWLLELQLTAAATALPLMQDLPIGVDPGGADVWADRDLFATGFSVGAPPDLFNTRGQDWGQPPFNPWRLRAASYAPFIAILRAAFHASRALRIDHVMGLFRLYWIPQDAQASKGVFVRYPADDLLDIVALESVRAGGWVVGEDLGTVEPVVREQMAVRDILSYRLLWFQEGPPSSLPRRAMSAVTTHDLPTVAGVWTGADLRAQRALGLEPNEAANQDIRERLVRVTGCAAGAPIAEVVTRAYEALAASPSMVVAAALEDGLEVPDRPNIPGTTTMTNPNWSKALPVALEEVLELPLVGRLAEILRRD